MLENNYKKTLLHLFIFSAAMAVLESAVVVYLRTIYYPDGFTVALKLVDEKILITELIREIATVVMLGGIAYISGKNFTQRFSYFLFCFAIWDIFYYVWLKLFINWPESFFTWDILFLIPVTWLGPVLAPVLCSITMILLAISLLHIQEKNGKLFIQKTDWLLLIAGSCLILFTFMQDYAGIIISNGWLFEMDQLFKNAAFIKITSNYIPSSFNWKIFMIGEIILMFSISIFWMRDFSFKTKFSNAYENH